MSKIGVVAIGRNEGERLRRCLDSLAGQAGAVVYVDSGSSDGSVESARDRGAQVVELDMSIPFCAARARNAGLERLRQVMPEAAYVFFVDGDCEIVAGFLDQAQAALDEQPKVAVVCGRRRERFPEASVYNRLCDMEWNTPVGPADACGGDALMRVAALAEVHGYRPTLIAGEEPEMCLRLRAAGWQVLRSDADMTLHDAAMTRFGQWWKRNVRAGHAFAEVSWLHRHDSLRLWDREARSNWIWGLLVPLAALLAAPFTLGLSLLLLLIYPVQMLRIARGRRRAGDSPRDARIYGVFCTLSKFPQVLGQLKFHKDRLLSRQSTLIEYKQNTPAG